LPDIERSERISLARHVAEWMTAAALATPGQFRVSLSGGSTPKTLHGVLASDEFRGRFPWEPLADRHCSTEYKIRYFVLS
jgi:6-phosphogluconolactonase/glucosamine-6-phosphate isomerase/deaminase